MLQFVIGMENGLGEFVHHYAAVFTIGDLGYAGRNGGVTQSLPLAAQDLVAGLHLLGIGALGFDQGADIHRVAAGAACHPFSDGG